MRSRVIAGSRFLFLGTCFVTAAVTLFVACSSDDTATGAQNDSDGSADATFDTSTPSDASRDASITDAAPSVCETAQCGTANCGTCPDAAAVAFHDDFANKDFKVDGFEITNADYAAFVAVNVDVKTQPAFCAYNDDFTPTSHWPVAAGNENHPVEYVDWCDAYAYCAWAGRALCANVDGGPNDTIELDNPDQSAWFHGCTNDKGGSGMGGWQSYPYSDSYNAQSCNGADRSDGGTLAVGSLTSCEGGAPGLYDMSGNVGEWENSCEDLNASDAGADASAISMCRVRGGSYLSGALDLPCAAEAEMARGASAAGVGFRCCSR